MCFGLCNPERAAAAVSVRATDQEGYSRLVFDWQQIPSYTIKKTADAQAVITFSKAADLEQKVLQSIQVPNISGISVISRAPLSVSIEISDQSQLRDLSIGNRIVVDVFDPPGGEKKFPVQSAQPASPPVPVKNKETKPESVAQNSEKNVQQQSTAITPKEQAVKPEPQKKAEEEQTVALKSNVAPTIILLSATHSFGLATFMLGDRFFVVNDKSDLLIRPQFSGPLAQKIGPVLKIPSDSGEVFAFTPPQRVKFKGQGGGPVWRVLFSEDIKPLQSEEPYRKDIPAQKDRGGKIIWPLKNARSLLDVTDPLSGQTIKVVTVEQSDQSAGSERQFVDFDVLQSPIGLAVLPKVDDLQLKITQGGVEISRPSGLSFVDETLVKAAKVASLTQRSDTAQTSEKIFDFQNWQLGGLPAVQSNRMILLEGLKDLSEGGRHESLLTLAKMYVSNGMGNEAQGVLNFALTDFPLLLDSPEFLALRGVAQILSGQYETGFLSLSLPVLAPYTEIQFWRAAALANLGDWQQASEVMPESAFTIFEYPPAISNRLLPVFSEIALRAGDVTGGKNFLSMLAENEETLLPTQAAALSYLKGEAARQEGKIDETKRLWEELTTGSDDLYRAKAGLALARLLVDKKEITPDQAIDRLERIRYAWRGDDLEAHISSWLGRTYFESKDYIKGLKIMRESATFVPETDLSRRITGDMSDLFTDLFLSDKLDAVSPLDAVAIYNEFSELMPLDARGDQIVERLAEHLVKSDLLGRAADLLDYQIKHRLDGEQAYRTAVRLAAIRLLDSQPDKAMAVLNLAQQKFSELPEAMKTTARSQELSLLRARALSKQGRPDQSLEMLRGIAQTPDVNKLRADIAWTAGYWDDAAEALGDVIFDQNIMLTQPLVDKHADLIVRRAIALNLAGDRVALADMRTQYSDAMNTTSKGKIFEVITRPRQSAVLTDRETLLGIVSEVDLFSDFLNSYKTMQTPIKPQKE